MSKHYLIQDQGRCTGCLDCMVNCRANKGLAAEDCKPCQIFCIGPKFEQAAPRVAHIFLACFHCEDPVCVKACPTEAMRKREKDGIVYVDADRCVGCKVCMMVCPWGAPQFNPETGKVVKCDLCMDRLDKGLSPACVAACPTKCLHCGSMDDLPEQKMRMTEPVGGGK